MSKKYLGLIGPDWYMRKYRELEERTCKGTGTN